MEINSSGQQERERIVAVQKNGDGDLTSFKTENGRILAYDEAIAEAGQGKLAGVNVFKGRDGGHYLRGDADGDPTNNLDNLPVF